MIPIKTLISCILVKEGVRPAMLVQPIDYGEERGSDPITKSILDEIKTLFPELICSEDYEGDYQGIIISYKDFTGETVGLNDMGRILGYPCYSEYETLNREVEYYGIYLSAIFEDGSIHQIFANVCKDKSRIGEFQSMAVRATDVLGRPEYAQMFASPVHHVYVEINPITPTMYLLDKVIDYTQELTSNDVYEILNVIPNIGYPEELLDELEKIIQYDNPFHRGVLASFLIDLEYDLAAPFYPLKGQLLRHYNIVMERRGDMILDIIGRTRDRNEQSSVHGDKERFNEGLLYSTNHIDKDNNRILKPFEEILEEDEELREEIDSIQEAKTKKIHSILNPTIEQDKDALLLPAIRRNDIDEVARLIDDGADINSKHRYGQTPLHWACINGYVEVAELLLERGANLTSTNDYEWTPLHYACYRGHLDLTELLLDKYGANVESKINNGWTPLHLACRMGNLNIAELLLDKYGADVESKDKARRTPLHAACLTGKMNIVEVLLNKYGADSNSKDNNGETAIDVARNHGNNDIVELLEEVDSPTMNSRNQTLKGGNRGRRLKTACKGRKQKMCKTAKKGCKWASGSKRSFCRKSKKGSK
uniref:Uncharacterized protein n=1 Tax=viral metagenome TaxID=1070528 RepID=A0A6C0I3B6_9ZZZZ